MTTTTRTPTGLRLYCERCGYRGTFTYAGRRGGWERYQCPECKTIKRYRTS